MISDGVGTPEPVPRESIDGTNQKEEAEVHVSCGVA
jgi:hypothetical protein